MNLWKSFTFKFDGATFDRERDFHRLKTQLQRVLICLLDGEWHDTPTLRRLYGSAADTRARDLRKAHYGSMIVDERVKEGSRSVHEYRLDLERVDPLYVQLILDNDITVPKAPKTVPDELAEVLSGLHDMVDQLGDTKELRNAYRLVHKELEKVRKRGEESSSSAEYPGSMFLDQLEDL
jgi:hypothetical protein